MAAVMDNDMERVAHALWPRPLRLEEAIGGLFNRVVRVTSPVGVHYLKRFTDLARSGDFPPLPTSAAQRCLVAASWHDLASRASHQHREVTVPALQGVHTDLDLVVMEEVAGQPLFETLVGAGGRDDGVLDDVLAWLATLHGMNLQPREMLLEASQPFKRFKIDLQYIKVLPEIPRALHASAQGFVGAYLAADGEPVHGDINSRNVLVGPDGVAVIDFEQGHFGEGLYDVAYIVSEYVIRALVQHADPEVLAQHAWSTYERHRCVAAEAKTRWRIHLGFQTLYRLVGPSRTVWTGHLDEPARRRVRDWSLDQLARWLR